MRTIDWTWFWYVLVGVLVGGGAVYLWFALKEKVVKPVWYEWLMMGLGFVIFIFMSQTFIASFGEGESRAAWMSLLFMGIPVILLAVGAFRSIQSRLAKPA